MIIDRLHQMATKAKPILGEPVECQKPLSLSWCGKPSPMPLTLPRGFVRHFRTVVGMNVMAMIHRRHHRTVSHLILLQVVGD